MHYEVIFQIILMIIRILTEDIEYKKKCIEINSFIFVSDFLILTIQTVYIIINGHLHFYH